MTEEQAYELMCERCPDAKRCHDDCEVCEDFLAATEPETLYECQSCGYRFSEPVGHWEVWAELGKELVFGCPVCGGGYIELSETEEDNEGIQGI